MKSEAMQLASEAASNKAAGAVAAGTVAISSASLMQILQSSLSLVGLIAGIVLSCVLIRKHWIETEIIKKRGEERNHDETK